MRRAEIFSPILLFPPQSLQRKSQIPQSLDSQPRRRAYRIPVSAPQLPFPRLLSHLQASQFQLLLLLQRSKLKSFGWMMSNDARK